MSAKWLVAWLSTIIIKFGHNTKTSEHKLSRRPHRLIVAAWEVIRAMCCSSSIATMTGNAQFVPRWQRVPAVNAEHDFVGALGASAILDSDCPMNCPMEGNIWIDHTAQHFGHPRQYSPGSAPLNFGCRKSSAVHFCCSHHAEKTAQHFGCSHHAQKTALVSSSRLGRTWSRLSVLTRECGLRAKEMCQVGRRKRNLFMFV